MGAFLRIFIPVERPIKSFRGGGSPVLVVLVPALPERDVRPDLVGHRLPVCRIGRTLVAEVVYGLGGLQIRAVGTGVVDHLPQQLGIFQHRTGPQVVFVERLPIVIGHEEGAAEDVEDAAVVDVGVGIVDKDARLCIARRIDMKIVASACDASAHKLAIVLEVHRIKRNIALF